MNRLTLAIACAALILAGRANLTQPEAIEAAPKPSQTASERLVERTWTPSTSRSFVRSKAASRGWTGREWKCLDEIIHAESRWNPKADNPTSTAYGLFQQLKLNRKAGVEKQTRLGLRYITSRYGSPCKARAFQLRNGWY